MFIKLFNISGNTIRFITVEKPIDNLMLLITNYSKIQTNNFLSKCTHLAFYYHLVNLLNNYYKKSLTDFHPLHNSHFPSDIGCPSPCSWIYWRGNSPFPSTWLPLRFVIPFSWPSLTLHKQYFYPLLKLLFSRDSIKNFKDYSNWFLKHVNLECHSVTVSDSL